MTLTPLHLPFASQVRTVSRPSSSSPQASPSDSLFRFRSCKKLAPSEFRSPSRLSARLLTPTFLLVRPPVWAELAESLKGQVPLYELDCEANRAICKAEGVPGYPQLILCVSLPARSRRVTSADT